MYEDWKRSAKGILEEMEDYQAHGPMSTLLAPPWLAVLVGRAWAGIHVEITNVYVACLYHALFT